MAALSNFTVPHTEFVVDAVLFDMDGTLTDSIKAVEAAWGAVATDLKMDPVEVIAATHGRRAIDNLKDLKPKLRRLSEREMDPHVEHFERSILSHADEYGVKLEEARSRRNSSAGNSRSGSRSGSRRNSMAGSKSGSRKGSMAGSRKGSFANVAGKPPLMSALSGFSALSMTSAAVSSGSATPADSGYEDNSKNENDDVFEDDDEFDDEDLAAEIDVEDRGVVILPGVRRMIGSIPEGKYAVATSGARTYCHGCLERVSITPPKVTITADHHELKRGKPFPDPFILAAEHLGYDPKKCMVVEDSPSGIKAGVASGATVLAVCTSHPREKISHCGAHYIVPSLDHVRVHVEADGTLRIVLDDKDSFPPDNFSEPADASVLSSKLNMHTVLETVDEQPATTIDGKKEAGVAVQAVTIAS